MYLTPLQQSSHNQHVPVCLMHFYFCIYRCLSSYVYLLDNITTEPYAHDISVDIVRVWPCGYIPQHYLYLISLRALVCHIQIVICILGDSSVSVLVYLFVFNFLVVYILLFSLFSLYVLVSLVCFVIRIFDCSSVFIFAYCWLSFCVYL
jgi:hypothetical protein